ncbi:MAG: dynamin family protein, partial [Deltaproteobacteria bacterium]|nr:dynamin family protein [Deltaproteobacteria bacterium]
TFEGRLALAILFEDQDQPEAAMTALRSALRLRPDSAVARGHLRVAFRRRLDLESTADDATLYPTFARVEKLLAAHPATATLAPSVARIRQDLDRPLLVAVMGEFNTGKSTFVNALIGEEIAPMGITPTTATINILKYGEARAARVVWNDDREELLPWEEVGSFLRTLDNTQARKIRVVELLEPAEALLRVNVVDTPGLNSIVEDHEQTAREFLDEADAVIWLFAADQAGKETEEIALEMLERQHLKTVGVINKIDRLTADELTHVVAHLQKTLGDYVEAMLPVSAKHALAARRAKDDAALDESQFPILRSFLDERIFSRSRHLKRQAARRRLRELAGEGRDQIVRLLDAHTQRSAHLDALRETLTATWRGAEHLDAERRALQDAFSDVFRRGAEEVLDFVRPRRWRLGSHQVDPADRDFLLELLTDGLRQLADDSRDRVLAILAERGAQVLGGLSRDDERGASASLVERVLADQRALLAQQVYERFFAFARGFLSGGRIDDFVSRRLPDLDLDLDAIFSELSAHTPTFASELIDPLRAWDATCLGAVGGAIDEIRREATLLELELEATGRDPLARLERELAGEILTPSASPNAEA